MARATRPESARSGRLPRANAGPAAPRRRWTPLGRVETAAPAAALLRALRELRPQFALRVQREAAAAGGSKRYRIEIAVAESAEPRGAVPPWLRVKSALLAAFPADKPNAVRALD
jgi:hypothetical protein